MISYCLPVTTFSTEELHNIQKHFIYLLLPKLGMNRHTPCDVIYIPCSHGGRGLIDLRIEQPLCHLRMSIGHMRRNGSAGRSLRASLIGHQVMAGVSKPFYTYPTQTPPYLPNNTRWCYVWNVIQQ